MQTCAKGGCERMVNNRSLPAEDDPAKLVYQTRVSCFTCGRASEWEPRFHNDERYQTLWSALVATQ